MKTPLKVGSLPIRLKISLGGDGQRAGWVGVAELSTAIPALNSRTGEAFEAISARDARQITIFARLCWVTADVDVPENQNLTIDRESPPRHARR